MVNERRKFFLEARARQTPKHSGEFNVLADHAANIMNRGAGQATVESLSPLCRKLAQKEKQEYKQLLEERKKTLDQLVADGHISKTSRNYINASIDIEKLLRYLDEPEVSS